MVIWRDGPDYVTVHFDNDLVSIVKHTKFLGSVIDNRMTYNFT